MADKGRKVEKKSEVRESLVKINYVRHVNIVGREGGYCGVEIVAQTDVYVAHLDLVAFEMAPLGERFEKLFDGYEEASNGRFDRGLEGEYTYRVGTLVRVHRARSGWAAPTFFEVPRSLRLDMVEETEGLSRRWPCDMEKTVGGGEVRAQKSNQ